MKERHPKLEGIVEKIRLAAESGDWRLLRSADERMCLQNVIASEVESILLNGWHNAVKDVWSHDWESWRYAIHGEVDDISLKIGLSFDGVMWVVTDVERLQNGK